MSLPLKVILVGEDLLTTLAASHTVLLLLAELGGCELLGLLGSLDLVTPTSLLAIFIQILLIELTWHQIGPPPRPFRSNEDQHLGLESIGVL